MKLISRCQALAVAILPGVLAAAPAAAAPPADPNSIVTLDIENDGILQNSDKYYTAGQRLGWTSPTDDVPGGLANLSRMVWGDGRQRIAIDLQQTLFTPANTQIKPPQYGDRPYAGVLVGDLNLISDTDRSRSVLGFGAGVIGPLALGEEVQNGFHSIIGDHHNQGWGYQVHGSPVIQLTAERIWRVPLADFAGIEADALPELAASVGTWRDYAQAGLQFRIGQGLRSDFGAARIRPGLTGSDAYTQTQPFVWYVFGGADGQAVGVDETLDSYTYRTLHVNKEPVVGEVQGGIALMAFGARLSFVHVAQTKTFNRQQSGFFNFDGIALSVGF